MSVHKRSYSSIIAGFEAKGKVETIQKVAKSSHIAVQTIPLEITSPLFVYTPLQGANTIRLLFLYPAYDFTAPIKCELVQVDSQSLQPDFHYEALSYAWGNTTEKRPINIQQRRRAWKVGGSRPIYEIVTVTKRLDVTENLESALRHLRHGQKIRTLWIDAISINQSDADERSGQVKRMHLIYSRATRVCVWLGPEADDSDQAMVFVDKVLHILDLENLVKAPAYSDSWKALLSLITRPWFSRRWVVQEVGVARRATVFCGTRCVPWSKLADAINLFEKYRHEISKHLTLRLESGTVPSQPADLHAAAAHSLVRATSNLFTRDAKSNLFNYMLSLEELLALLPDFYTSEPRDILYALVSLAKDTCYSADDYSGPLPMDYSKNFSDICRDFVYLTISKTGSLDIICRPWAKICPGSNVPDVPTWVQLLQAPAKTSPEFGCFRQQAESLVGTVGKPIYCAAGNKKAEDMRKFYPKALTWLSPPCLIVRGMEVDIVAEIGACATRGVVPISWKDMSIEAEMENGILSPKECKRTSAFFPDSFWRILVANRDVQGHSPPTWYRVACESILELSRGCHIDTSQLINDCNNSCLIEFLQRVQAVTWNKKWVTTLGDASEVRMGFVSEKAQVEDRIFILHGCSVPVLLRKCQDHYIFVGECYIHNWMDGEFLQERREVFSVQLR